MLSPNTLKNYILTCKNEFQDLTIKANKLIAILDKHGIKRPGSSIILACPLTLEIPVCPIALDVTAKSYYFNLYEVVDQIALQNNVVKLIMDSHPIFGNPITEDNIILFNGDLRSKRAMDLTHFIVEAEALLELNKIKPSEPITPAQATHHPVNQVNAMPSGTVSPMHNPPSKNINQAQTAYEMLQAFNDSDNLYAISSFDINHFNKLLLKDKPDPETREGMRRKLLEIFQIKIDRLKPSITETDESFSNVTNEMVALIHMKKNALLPQPKSNLLPDSVLRWNMVAIHGYIKILNMALDFRIQKGNQIPFANLTLMRLKLLDITHLFNIHPGLDAFLNHSLPKLQEGIKGFADPNNPAASFSDEKHLMPMLDQFAKGTIDLTFPGLNLVTEEQKEAFNNLRNALIYCHEQLRLATDDFTANISHTMEMARLGVNSVDFNSSEALHEIPTLQSNLHHFYESYYLAPLNPDPLPDIEEDNPSSTSAPALHEMPSGLFFPTHNASSKSMNKPKTAYKMIQKFYDNDTPYAISTFDVFDFNELLIKDQPTSSSSKFLRDHLMMELTKKTDTLIASITPTDECFTKSTNAMVVLLNIKRNSLLLNPHTKLIPTQDDSSWADHTITIDTCFNAINNFLDANIQKGDHISIANLTLMRLKFLDINCLFNKHHDLDVILHHLMPKLKQGIKGFAKPDNPGATFAEDKDMLPIIVKFMDNSILDSLPGLNLSTQEQIDAFKMLKDKLTDCYKQLALATDNFSAKISDIIDMAAAGPHRKNTMPFRK